MAKKKYYAVKKGYKTGVFDNWTDCQSAISGYSNAEYKGFATEEEANHPIIFRNGIGYINRGAGNVWINSVYYDEGWTPLSKYSD